AVVGGAERLERGPTGICRRLLVLVRLDVQILAADGAEPGAVGAAQDLVRQRERDRVAGPRREVERLVADVGRAQLLVPGLRRVVLAPLDRELEHRIREAAEPTPVQPDSE